MALKKITETEMDQQGVCAAPDILDGSPAENKSIFDRMVRKLIAPAYNECVDAVNQINEEEAQWAAAEEGRVEAESGRVAAEEQRVRNELDRQTNEQARSESEAERKTAEEARKTAETQRAAAEEARKTAENARVEAENARVDENTGIVARATEQADRAVAEANKAGTSSENAAQYAQKSETNAENAQKHAEDASAAAETAGTKAANAAASADAAKKSAEDAAASAAQFIVDNTLTVSGSPADAKVVGDAIRQLQSDVAAKVDGIWQDPDSGLWYLTANGEPVGDGITISGDSGGLAFDSGYVDESGYLHLTMGGEDLSADVFTPFFVGTGGTGGGTGSTMKLTSRMASRTFSVMDTAATVDVLFAWSSVDSEDGSATGNGSASWYVGGTRVAVQTITQGDCSFDIKPYLTATRSSSPWRTPTARPGP